MAIPVNSTAISVTWDAPEFPNGIIRNYIVTYNTSGEHSGTMGVDSTMDNSTSLLIDSLVPFTLYNVYVVGVTVGEGPSSDVVMVMTNESGTWQSTRNIGYVLECVRCRYNCCVP